MDWIPILNQLIQVMSMKTTHTFPSVVAIIWVTIDILRNSAVFSILVKKTTWHINKTEKRVSHELCFFNVNQFLFLFFSIRCGTASSKTGTWWSASWSRVSSNICAPSPKTTTFYSPSHRSTHPRTASTLPVTRRFSCSPQKRRFCRFKKKIDLILRGFIWLRGCTASSLVLFSLCFYLTCCAYSGLNLEAKIDFHFQFSVTTFSKWWLVPGLKSVRNGLMRSSKMSSNWMKRLV